VQPLWQRFNALLAVGVLSLPAAGAAGEIGVGDFGPRSRTEDFESLAADAEPLAGELVLHDNTFKSNYNHLRVYRPTSHPVDQVCLGGPPEGYAPRTGTCIGTGLVDLETLEIILGTPAIRAGLWVGLTERRNKPRRWSAALVQFFDEGGTPLGSVEVYGHTYGFAGWEVDPRKPATRIAKIWVQDIADNGRVLAIDNLMWEPPPDP
jgi:hypothetical protein